MTDLQKMIDQLALSRAQHVRGCAGCKKPTDVQVNGLCSACLRKKNADQLREAKEAMHGYA